MEEEFVLNDRKNYLTNFVKDNRHLIITVGDFDASYWKSWMLLNDP
jgi:hypothetical protein